MKIHHRCDRTAIIVSAAAIVSIALAIYVPYCILTTTAPSLIATGPIIGNGHEEIGIQIVYVRSELTNMLSGMSKQDVKHLLGDPVSGSETKWVYERISRQDNAKMDDRHTIIRWKGEVVSSVEYEE
ncbi:MAG: hypothetical protein U0796_00335 [Gemmatales bacterium]